MCFIVLIGAVAPRFALFLMALFSDRISQAIDNWALSLAGFFFLPFTTFFYVLAWAPVRHVSGLGWFFVVFGFLLDLGNYTNSGSYAKRRGASR
jgi:hypothetical protein